MMQHCMASMFGFNISVHQLRLQWVVKQWNLWGFTSCLELAWADPHAQVTVAWECLQLWFTLRIARFEKGLNFGRASKSAVLLSSNASIHFQDQSELTLLGELTDGVLLLPATAM